MSKSVRSVNQDRDEERGPWEMEVSVDESSWGGHQHFLIFYLKRES